MALKEEVNIWNIMSKKEKRGKKESKKERSF